MEIPVFNLLLICRGRKEEEAITEHGNGGVGMSAEKRGVVECKGWGRHARTSRSEKKRGPAGRAPRAGLDENQGSERERKRELCYEHRWGGG
jgi:hypothetical protein